MKYMFLGIIALGLPAHLHAEKISPLFEVGTPAIQTFSSGCTGYGALGEDQSHVAVYVSRRDARHVPIQARATVRLGAPEGVPISIPGYVTDVLSEADPRTGQAIVTIAIARQELQPRTYASATIELGGRRALALPTTAVIISSGTPVVYLETKPGEFHEKIVQIGTQGSEYTEIKNGLKATDRVLIKGALEWDRQSVGGSNND